MMSSWQEFQRNHTKFANINIDAVKRIASSVRGDVDCNVSDDFGSGVDNVAFTVNFADGIKWVVRVHGKDNGDHKDYIASQIESTVATMKYVQRHSSIPVPTIYTHQSHNETPGLGAGYIIMDFVSGEEVDLTLNALSAEEESQVYGQLAEITCMLSQLRFTKIGCIYETSEGDFTIGPFIDRLGKAHGPFDNSIDFFKYKVESITRPRDDWFISYDARKEALEQSRNLFSLYNDIASELSDYDCGSFPLCHGDLGTHNTLFNRDANGKWVVSGILDWDYAHTGPWLELGQFPVLLEIRWPYLHRYASFVLESIRRKQHTYLEGVKECEVELRNGGPRLSTLIDCPAVRVAEFVLRYSDPEFKDSRELLLKYVREWKTDWK
jgi:aminoglycoside phosphotransferase (APT) family kinase protein